MRAIPDQMKHDIWAFYVLASSNNPEIMVPNTRKLVGRLMSAVKIAGTDEFDRMLDTS